MRGVNPLVQDAVNRLRTAGFRDFELVREIYDEKHFGNAEAVFRVGRLFVRFWRDRGQDFLDLSSAPDETFYLFDDVDIAMGWKSVDDVLGKLEPEDTASVLHRFFQKFAQLEHAFSGHQSHLTRALVEKAAKERGDAFVARLRGGR
jgi:hypothetical protein